MCNIAIFKKEESPLMRAKKAAMRRVMLKAWAIQRSRNISFALALKKAWAWHKQDKTFLKNQFVLFA